LREAETRDEEIVRLGARNDHLTFEHEKMQLKKEILEDDRILLRKKRNRYFNEKGKHLL